MSNPLSGLRPTSDIRPPTSAGAKLIRIGDREGYPDGGLGHWCPGCRMLHVFPRSVANIGSAQAPTFAADKTVTWRGFGALIAAGRCHYAVASGRIAFFPDCTHGLAGQIVPLPELPGHVREAASA